MLFTSDTVPTSLGLLGFVKVHQKSQCTVRFLELATYPYIHEYKGFSKQRRQPTGTNI